MVRQKPLCAFTSSICDKDAVCKDGVSEEHVSPWGAYTMQAPTPIGVEEWGDGTAIGNLRTASAGTW